MINANRRYVWVIVLCLFSLSIQAKVVRIGISHMPPVSYIDTNQKPRGFIVDLMQALGDKEGWQIQWVYEDWSVLVEQIKNGDIDLLPSTGYSEERDKFMDFSKSSFLTVWGQVFVNPQLNIKSILDLDGKRIGVLSGGINGLRLKQLCETFEMQCDVVEISQYTEMFALINSGNLDAAASNNLVGQYFSRQYGLESTPILYDPFKVLVAAPEGLNADLLARYDSALAVWKKQPDSIYYELRKRWIDSNGQQLFSPWVWFALLALIVVALAAIFMAVSYKKQVNRRILELGSRQQQLDQIINLMPHMIYVADENGQILIANTTARNHFGISSDEQSQFNTLFFQNKNDHNSALFEDDEFLFLPDSMPIHKEVEVMDSEDKEKVLMLSKMPLLGRTHKIPAILTVGVDITQAKNYEEQIAYLAKFDVLTGLPNKVSLEEHITRALKLDSEERKSGALLLIDLDDFKNINDAQGHAIGDAVIKEVSERLKSCIRTGDMVARIGGDEFAVHLAALTDDINYTTIQAEQIAKVVHSLLRKPYEVGGFTYHITASIGAVIYPLHGDSQQLLLQRADTAVYKAKDTGKNKIYVFEPEFETEVIKKHTLENALREAVDKDQLRLEYQPVVNAERKVVGAEALVRWERPGEGMVSPADFIEVAENSGLIAEIGDWVIDNVCQQIREWINAGKNDFFIAVNLSVNQIRDKNFYHKVEYLIQQHQVPQNYLEFEVTESMLMHERERSINILNQLKLLGIRLSIDDFGTGYSSFSYLLTLPLDKLKIDRMFMKDIPEDKNSKTIVKTIISMSFELGLEVVAEGIERQEQFDFLLQQSCQYYQGYFFNKPLSAEKLSLVAIV